MERPMVGSRRHSGGGGCIFFDDGETNVGGMDRAGSTAFGAVGGMAREGWFDEVLGGDEIGRHFVTVAVIPAAP